MDSITNSLSHNAGFVLLGLLLFCIVLIGLLVMNTRKIGRLNQMWSELSTGTSGQNLEQVLYEHLRERMRTDEELESLRGRIAELEKKMLSSKRFVGMVRYDAFDDVGGNQSFALAIYDDNGNGAIVTSLVGRMDCRVYCKPLVNGRSDRSLSPEEQRAMQDAVTTAPRAVVES